jgi:hypothetical protein
MDVLDGNLKAVEALGFRQHDLCGKVAAKIFIDDAIRCREKSQDVGYEVLLRWLESVPVCGISREVNLLGSPKGRFGLLYILQMSSCWMGKRMKRLGFAWSNGSGARWSFVSAVLCFDALRRGGFVLSKST